MKFIDEMGFKLPPFAFMSPCEWEKTGREADEIRDNMLGWDITDFGRGDFKKFGLVLFTIRNGNSAVAGKPYAEKVMVLEEGQVTPMHYHRVKMEDIINRGGGELAIRFFHPGPGGGLSDRKVFLSVDGFARELEPGSQLKLSPGESVTVPPFLYHEFSGARGKVLAGEVSMVNDDRSDNFFLEETGRFPEIEEDEEPGFMLCGEYPAPPG